MKKFTPFLFATFLLCISPKFIFAAAPSFNSVTSDKTSVSKYAKIEWTFDLSKTYANPYYFYDAADTSSTNPSTMTWFGVDGVSVDIHLTSPSGKTIIVPGFWMEDYTRAKDNNFSSQGIEILGKKDNGRWHVRFAPSEVGTYQYYLTAQDKDGSGRYPTSGSQSFTVGSSQLKGFIHASATDPRFLQYDNGQSYIPIGSGRQWWNDNVARSFDYENAFTKFGQNGINLVRVWDQIDFALSLEGVGQPLWLDQNTVYGAAQGIELNTPNVHAGMRSAKPSVGHSWYQRIVFSEPTKQHKLSVWVKTDSVSGGNAQINVRSSTSFNAGTVLGQTAAIAGTTGWTLYTFTFTPNTSVASVNLLQTAGTGTVYIDDLSVGPVDGSGNLSYNIVSDGDFERHFYKGNPGNDPDATPTLARPIGTYMNQWADYEMDKIVESAESNGVAIQACSCSGPWFTWPKDPSGNISDSDWGTAWFLKSNERNFRYRVARWGYSPAILGWELHNEQGHVNSSGTPGIWSFLQNYSVYQKATDPYNHLKTTSQNSQAYSPGMWSTFYDISNYHWYLDGHSSTLDPDEALTVSRFAWCLSDTRGTSSSYCQGLGLGDGTTWTGHAKPWIWGEIGFTETQTDVQGERGKRFLHNIVWAGLFSPLGTTPLEWHWYYEDATASTEKFNSRKAASLFFNAVDYANGNFTYLPSTTDIPPGYTGETITTSDTKARIAGIRRGDKKAAYLWIQNRDYIWSKASTTPTTITPTITVNNMISNDTYKIEVWNTSTGTVISTQQRAASGAALSFSVTLTTDIAVKVESTNGVPSLTSVPTTTPIQKQGDANGDGKVDGIDYITWLNHYNTSVSGAVNGDFNNDGKVDGIDYIVWLNNYGS